MVKFFIVYALEILGGITLITQVIIPIFIDDLKFFWFFRRSEPKKSPFSSLEELDQKATQVKQQRDEINQNLSSAESTLREIKEKTY